MYSAYLMRIPCSLIGARLDENAPISDPELAPELMVPPPGLWMMDWSALSTSCP